ncbi:hypothetical protein QFZ76_001583 [Streptomyces sp. V4I2]|nr:hypothetical protein [Streptomyces sp. V4I2]
MARLKVAAHPGRPAYLAEVGVTSSRTTPMVTTASPGLAASGEPLPPETTVTGTPL